MIITTAKKARTDEIEEAQWLAEKWDHPYEPRRKKSFQQWLRQRNESIYAVGAKQDKLYHPASNHPLTFHPSMAWIRYQRLKKGGKDPMVEAAGLREGMTFLDGTLGLASDSIVASTVTGEMGNVCGVECHPFMARLVQKGLKHWEEDCSAFNRAMRRINLVTGEHGQVLENMSDHQVDVVYFDPMFEKAVDASVHLKPLRLFASHEPLQRSVLTEAIRVAGKRVVVKTTSFSSSLESLGFTWMKRAGASFSYAVLDKGEEIE
ncbi:class I SAM-dependent methyltransferase [Salibacterium aidingense]|uniref:class I SAM-dependent methyltransferase n=1 Tax=Salibacterium aidingense TaxID=384933 RepID=UPI003BED6DE7